MEHKNSFKIYKDMIASGSTEAQAEAYVNGLDSVLDDVATKDDLISLEKDLKIFFSWLVGGAILATYIIPLVIALILKYFNIV